jgi:hypothetical protein
VPEVLRIGLAARNARKAGLLALGQDNWCRFWSTHEKICCKDKRCYLHLGDHTRTDGRFLRTCTSSVISGHQVALYAPRRAGFGAAGGGR